MERTSSGPLAQLAMIMPLTLLITMLTPALTFSSQEGFSENFDGETWELLQQQGWKMAWDSPYYEPSVSVVDGQLLIDMYVGGWGRSTYVWLDENWTNFSASLKWNTIENWRHSTARVILRVSGLPELGGGYPDIAGWQGIFFSMGGYYGRPWLLFLRVDTDNDGVIEEYTLEEDWTKSPYCGSWHLVQASIFDNNIKIWVDGALWADVTDDRIPLLPAGGISLLSYEADTLFDNVLVEVSTSPPAVENELVAYWKFDEGSGDLVYDNSGYGNHGTIYGATWTSGKINGALYFDGFNDAIEVPDSTSLHISNTITVGAWIKYEGGDNVQINTVLTKRSGESGFSLGTQHGKVRFSVGSTYFDYVEGTTTLQPGKWYHLVGTYDGTTQKIYVNGLLDGSRLYSGQLSSNTAPLFIGLCISGETGAKYGYFTGIIDEVRIYNRALNSDEIAELAGLENKNPTSLLVSPSSFTIESGQAQTLTAALNSSGSPLVGKAITWSAGVGEISPESGTTDNLGQISGTYTAPITDHELWDNVIATFAGDNQYEGSIGASEGLILPENVPGIPTQLAITPASLTLQSGQSTTLIATLTAENSPLAGKTISWNVLHGVVSPESGMTDNLGQISVTYTAPTTHYETLDNIVATFAGDNQYRGSVRTAVALILPENVPEKIPTQLVISPSSFTLQSGQSTTLTVTLVVENAPLAGKTITWSATSGSFSPSSGTTNTLGQVTVTYTTPTVSASTSVTVTASFAGDNQYQSSTDTSSGNILFIPQQEAVVDIKPDTLQIGSPGQWVTCYIELPGGNVDQIDMSSILLEEAIQVDSAAPTEIGDYDGDSALDLMVNFDRLSVENIVVQGLVTLTVTGHLDGSTFTGSDTIDVIQTPPTSPAPGALVSVRLESPGVEPTVRYDIFSFTLDLSTEVSEELIEVTVGSETSEGQTIVLNIDNDVLPLEDPDEIAVLFDNQEIEMADDYEDILDPTDEDEAEYVIILGGEGVQLLVSIPHFSIHTITVGKAAAPPEGVGISSAAVLAVVGVSLVVVISAALIGIRQARGAAASKLIERGLSNMRLQEVDIFREIRDQKEFTISEIMHETGVSKTVAWYTVQKLIKKGLVKPTGKVKLPAAGRGKPSTVYKYVGD
jgi:hypothetical protein